MTGTYASLLQQAASQIGGWQTLPFFHSTGQFQNVLQYLQHDPRIIYPDACLVFDALRRVQPCDVRVVIFGQDPYPSVGRATGHAFAIPNSVARRPLSLKNILQVCRSTVGPLSTNQDLMCWVDQGVLLLNTALTVPRGMAGCHCGIGWQFLIDDLIRSLSGRQALYWMFWGRKAQALRPQSLVTQQFMQTSHPAARGHNNTFLQSSPFVSANAFLSNRGLPIIRW